MNTDDGFVAATWEWKQKFWGKKFVLQQPPRCSSTDLFKASMSAEIMPCRRLFEDACFSSHDLPVMVTI